MQECLRRVDYKLSAICKENMVRRSADLSSKQKEGVEAPCRGNSRSLEGRASEKDFQELLSNLRSARWASTVQLFTGRAASEGRRS
mmetsp:Transcript_44012/g.94841  ORF Transcript_44012/g.94841 Transcript_44012/m.94841 type:complete len:86 (+) Transcript_44012:361-618(+)